MRLFASHSTLRALEEAEADRGTLRVLNVDGAAFVTLGTDPSGNPLQGSAADPPAWTKDVGDQTPSSIPWVRIRESAVDAILEGNANAQGLNDFPVDAGLWPEARSVVVLMETTAFAFVVTTSKSGGLRPTPLEPTGPAEPFGSDPGFEAVDDFVLQIGAGAIGSHLALMLPNWGLRRLLLVDRDRLTQANVTSHVCDPEAIGQNKAKAVARNLKRHFSPVSALGLDLDVLRAPDVIRGWLDDVSLIVVAVDDPVARQLCNHLAVASGKPAVFVGLFRRGLLAEVISYSPGHACLNCTRLALPIRPGEAQSEDGPTSPSRYRGGLRTDAQWAAALAARSAAALAHGPGEYLPGTPGAVLYSSPVVVSELPPPFQFQVPGQVNWVPLATDEACRVCRGGSPRDVAEDLDRARRLLGVGV